MQIKQMEEQLWNYIDGSAGKTEIAFIKQMIATDLVWKNKYAELLKMNQLLQTNLELEQPSLRFSKNVMDEIRNMQPAPATVHQINKKIIMGIAGFFILTITSFLIYSFTQVSWSITNETYSLPFNLKNFHFNKLHISNLINNTWINIIVMFNIILGLMLLNNYLTQKGKTA